MASIRKRGSNSYLIVVSRGYDYEGNRLKSVQKTVKPPKEYTPKQAEKWVKEQAILFEREVQHTPEPINRSITLAKYIEHWVADVGPKKLADSTYQRDLQDIRRILPALGKGLSQQMETLAAQRAEIVKQIRRKDASPELADHRAMLTCKIAELRKEDKIAEGAIKRIQRTRESNRIDRENQEHHTNHNRRRNRSRQR